MDARESIVDYLTRVKELIAVGESVSNSAAAIVFIVLNVLPLAYQNFVMMLSLQKTKPSFDYFISLQEEMRCLNLMNKEVSKNKHSLPRSKDKTTRKSKMDKGKQTQHYNQEEGLKRSPKRNSNCQYCSKFGHVAFECKNKQFNKKKQSDNHVGGEVKPNEKASEWVLDQDELLSTSTSFTENLREEDH
ncbi:hypothetical protein O6H91_06G013500 [Diphasiastrum complanatum]|uniref:Uncharacterized protein n=1 Tax=Diphasiastrum complanatum TaxID=34168 RepID=A0ACC2DAP8_DIPCM|nr:hypothetical protein O6H91_06G013500 [Diphasiastrum complanatum]